LTLQAAADAFGVDITLLSSVAGRPEREVLCRHGDRQEPRMIWITFNGTHYNSLSRGLSATGLAPTSRTSSAPVQYTEDKPLAFEIPMRKAGFGNNEYGSNDYNDSSAYKDQRNCRASTSYSDRQSLCPQSYNFFNPAHASTNCTDLAAKQFCARKEVVNFSTKQSAQKQPVRHSCGYKSMSYGRQVDLKFGSDADRGRIWYSSVNSALGSFGSHRATYIPWTGNV
jgi:hypothetical protein